MRTLLANASQLLTMDTGGKHEKRGKAMQDVRELPFVDIICEDGNITQIVPTGSVERYATDTYIDVTGKCVLPGLTDCHTHMAFAGSRAGEFRQKLAGAHYEEIAAAGGGIQTTVNAVRNASEEVLYELLQQRLQYHLQQGVTMVEIKSGYGLSPEHELKLLRVIRDCAKTSPLTIIPTFLGAHTIPAEYKHDREAYVQQVIRKMIPTVAAEGLAVYCDVFCEKTAFTAEETCRIFDAAVSAGMKVKIHTEQFNAIGGLQAALTYRAESVDHLEVLREEDIPLVADSGTAAVLLPGVSYFLNYDYAPARKLIDGGAKVALASDYNPGSSPIANISLLMSMAAIRMKMTIEEVLNAFTINAAAAVGRSSVTGSIEPGKRADFAVFDTEDYSDLVYQTGMNLCCMTIKNGTIIYQK